MSRPDSLDAKTLEMYHEMEMKSGEQETKGRRR